MRIGVLGVGELSEKAVRGLLHASPETEIYLSPRSRQRAENLTAATSCRLMESNQAVVDAVDVVLVGVRPHSLAELAQEICLRPDQTLVSLVAGAPLAMLKDVFRHDNCVRLMLTFAAEINKTTVILTSTDDAVRQAFAGLGQPVSLANEKDFELATVSVCMNGWFYFLADSLQQWFIEKGMSQADARQLVLSNMRDCAEYASHHSSRTLEEMGNAIASEGTWTALGQQILTQQHAADPWHNAAETLFTALHDDADSR